MATIKNIIQTVFTSQGAGRTINDVDHLGRAQTRLGQASASAGRSFAAQAQGMGGLVAAYAGAAATTFALQQAYDKLAKSARAAQTLQGLTSIAATAAIDGNKLLSSVQSLTKNQLTLVQAAEQTNLALSAGFNSKQIEGLSVVALKASRALGRDLTDAMTRVVRGSAKMETELLDELGIYTKIEPATRAYAAALNKSVSSLSEYERRQAFVNSVIAEGNKKFASINTVVPTSAEKIEAFGAKIIDLSQQLGMLLADGLAPLADFLTNNTAAAFSTLGVAISLVAGKGLTLLSEAFASMTSRIEQAGIKGELFVRSLFGLTKSANEATQAIVALDQSTLRLNNTESAALNTILANAQTRSLTRAEITQTSAIISRSIAAIQAESSALVVNRNALMAVLAAKTADRDAARASFETARAYRDQLVSTGAAASQVTAAESALASARGKLGATTRALNAAEGQRLATLEQTGNKILSLNADAARLDTTNKQLSAAANARGAGLAATLSFVARSTSAIASGFTSLLTGIVGLASKLLFIGSIFTLIGSTIANAVGKGEEFESFVNNLSNTFKSIFSNDTKKNAKNVFQGVAAGALANLEKIDSKLAKTDSFTFKEKFYTVDVKITKTKEELVKEVSSLLADASQGFEKTAKDAATSGKAAGGAFVGGMLGSLLTLIPGIGPLLGPTVGRALGAAVGFAAGSIWDYFSDLPEVPKDVADRLKQKFSNALAGFDTSVQDKIISVLAKLDEKYGAAAKIDPSARAALKLQQDLVLASAAYLENVDSIAQIMAATGEDASIIAKNFNFSKAVNDIEYLSEAVTSIGSIDLSFKFVDTLNEDVQKLLNSISIVKDSVLDVTTVREEFIKTGAKGSDILNLSDKEIATNLDIAKEKLKELTDAGYETSDALAFAAAELTDAAPVASSIVKILGEDLVTTSENAITLFDSFMKASTSIDAISNSAIRVSNILRDTKKGILDNSLSFEQYTQNISNAQNALVDAQRALPGARDDLAGYLSDMNRADLGTKQREEAEKLYNAARQRVATLEETVSLESNLLRGLKSQSEEYQRQIKFNEFIKNQTKDTVNEYEAGLKIARASLENSGLGELQYFVKFLGADTKNAINQFNDLKTSVKSITPALKDEEVAAVLRENSSNARDLAAGLKAAGVDAMFLRDGVIAIADVMDTPAGSKKIYKEIPLLAAETIKLATEGQGAYDALRQSVQESLQASAELINSASFANKIQSEKNDLLGRELRLKQQIADDSAIALAFEIQSAQNQETVKILEREVELLKLQKDLSNSIATSQKEAADIRIASIEYEADRAKELSDKRIADIEREADAVAANFSALLARNEIRFSVSNPEQDATKTKLEMQQAAAQLQSELQIIEEKRKTAQVEYNAQKSILVEKKKIADAEVQTAFDNFSRLLKLNKLEQDIREKQQSAEQAALREQIRAADEQLSKEGGILEARKALEKSKIENDYDLQKKQATQNAQNLVDMFKYLQAEQAINNDYLKGLESYLQQLKENSDITITTNASGADFSDVISKLESRVSLVGAEYDVLKSQAIALAETEIGLEAQKTQAARDAASQKLQANDAYFSQYNQLMADMDRAEEQSALNSIKSAQQVAAQQLQAINDLEAAGVEQVDSTKQAWLEYSTVVLNKLAEIASAVLNINEGLRLQKIELSQQAQLSEIQREQTSSRVAFENRSAVLNAEIANSQAQLSKLQAQQALDAASVSREKENQINAAKAQLELESAISESQRSQKERNLGNQIEDAQTLKELFDEMSGPQGFAGSVISALNLYDAQYKLAELQVDREREAYANELKAIDLETQLLESKKAASGANIKSIEEQQRLELEIFDKQQKLAKDERDQSIKDLESNIKILKVQNEINVAKAKQEETIARQNLASQRSQLESAKENLIGLNRFTEALSVVFFEGAAAVSEAFGLPELASTIRDKLNEVTTTFDLGNAEASVNAAFKDAESLISKGESLITSLYGGAIETPAGLKEVQGQVFSELEANFNSQLSDLEAQKTALEEVNALTESTVELQKEALKLQQQAALAQSAGEAQSIEAELTALRQRQVEASQALLAAEEKLVREKFKLASEVLSSIVKSVGKILTDNKQQEINKLKLQETIISQSLTSVTEDLNNAQQKQQDAISKEISLREELKAATDSLVEKQKEYIQALTGDDRSIVESGKLYIKTLLDQKKKAIELSKTVSERIRLDTQVKSLEERKIDLEKTLEYTTKMRVEAETELANLQQTLGVLTEIASGKIAMFISQIKSLIASLAGGSGLSLGSFASSAASLLGVDQIVGLFNPNGIVAKAFNKLFNAGEVLNKAGSSVAKAVGVTGSSKAGAIVGGDVRMGAASSTIGKGFWGTVGGAIGGAFQGFGIGQIVGAITNDPGMGSSIGGAIGGAIGTVFASQLVTAPIIGALATGIGGAIGVAASFVVPVIGAFIGAAIGRLFSKTPKAGVSGTISSSGANTITDSYQQKVPGGTAKNLSELTGGITSLIEGLNAAGIAFKDTLSYSVNLRKDTITGATLSSSSGASYESGSAKADAEGVKKISEFFTTSFLKTLREGSLIVDKTLQNAVVLQDALNKFVSLPSGDKTVERLKQSIDYANNFDKIIANLGEAIPVTMDDAIGQISIGAMRNADQIAAYYSGLKDQAAQELGKASESYKKLNKAIADNALAQLGLARGSDGVIRDINSAVNELNAGELMITNIIESLAASAAFLRSNADAYGDIAQFIDKAITSQLTNVVGDLGKNLTTSLELLKNPAKQATIELESIIANATARNTQMQGIVDGLAKSTQRIDASVMSTALDNVAKSVELGTLEIQTYIEALNIEQLKAVIADEDLVDARAKSAAQTRLAELEEADRAQALKNFIKVSRDFNKALAEASNSASIPQFAQSSTSAVEIAATLGKSKVDDTAKSISTMINNIAKGTDVVNNFNGTIAALDSQYSSGAITATQYVDALEILTSTTEDTIQVFSDMKVAFADTAQEIADAYTSLLDDLVTTTNDIGTTLTDLLDSFKTKSLDILKIYDTTLKDVATSGNEILDLRDTAKDAYSAAAQAVAEFEKANKLSGKSSSQITAQIATIQSQLDALKAKPFDFSSFVEFGKLSSQQRALQSELNTVVTKEQEYNKLLTARERAAGDVAFAEATVLSLGDQLIDSRRSESETIQKIQDATVDFTKSQAELKSITELLAAANFDLNVARFDEENRVVAVAAALTELSSVSNSLVTEVNGINEAFRQTLLSAAASNVEIKYANASETERAAKLKEASDSVNAYYTQLLNAGAAIKTIAQPFENVATQVNTTLKAALTSEDYVGFAAQLTDRFKGFSEDIVKYLDTEGLAKFYGPNGVFAQFKDSLYSTLVLQGFDILTTAGGPLEGFQARFGAVAAAIDGLTNAGAFLNTVITSVKLSFGELITAVGSTEAGLTSIVQVLINKVADSANVTLPNLNIGEGVGTLINEYLSAIGNVKSYQALTFTVEEANTLGWMVQTYLDSLDNANSYTALALSSTTGIGLSVQNFLNSLKTYSGFTLPSITADTGIGKAIGDFLANINTSTYVSASATAGIGKAVQAWLDSFNSGTSKLTAPTFSSTSGIGGSVQTFLSALGNSGNYTRPSVSGTTIGNIGQAVQLFLNSLSGSTSYTLPTVSTATGSKNIGEGIQAFLKALDSYAYAAPTVTTTTGLGKKINEYLAGLDTNVTLQSTATTGLGAAVQKFITSLGSAITYTGLTYDTKTKGTLGENIQNFITAINTAAYATPTIVTTTGIGSKVQSVLTNIGTASYTAPAISKTTGVGAVVQGLVNSIASTNVYTAPTLAATAGAPSLIQSYITGIAGVAYTPPPAVTISAGPGKRIQDYITSLDGFTGYTVPTLSTTAGLGKSIQGYIDSIKNTLTPAIGGIADVFTTARTTKIADFKAAVEALDLAGTNITASKDVVTAINGIVTGGASAGTKLADLSTKLAGLATALNPLVDSGAGKTLVKGQLTLITEVISGMAKKLQDAWNAVQLNVETNLGDSLAVNINNTGALSSGDSANLKTIADYSKVYPQIDANGLKYKTGTLSLATGGYVEGPGSATSDSVSANLSNGEYVVKASSTRRLGKRLLDNINATGDIHSSLAKEGRRGDTLLAHINPQEAALLKRLGGSGTRNPVTGLLEFFTKDAGAFAGLFQQEEINKLYSDHQSGMPSSIQPSNLPGFIRMDRTSSNTVIPYNPGQIFDMFGGDTSKAATAMRLAGNSLSLASRTLDARNENSLKGLSFGIGAANAAQNNIVAGFDTGAPLTIPNDKVGSGTGTRGGYGARGNQLISALAAREGETVTANTTGLSKDAVTKYVTGLNKDTGKLFFDFYMLGDEPSTLPIKTSVLGGNMDKVNVGAYEQSYVDGKYFESFRGVGPGGVGSYTYLENVSKAVDNQIANPFSLSGATAGTIEGAGIGMFAPSVLFGQRLPGTNGFANEQELKSYISSLVGGSGTDINAAVTNYVQQMQTARVNDILKDSGLTAVQGETFEQSIQRLIAKRTEDVLIAAAAERARLASISEAQRQLEARIAEVYLSEIGQPIGSSDLATYVSQLQNGSATLDTLRTSLNNSAAGRDWDLRQLWQPVYDDRKTLFNPFPLNQSTMDGRPGLSSLDMNWKLLSGKNVDTLKSDVDNYWATKAKLALSGPKTYTPPVDSTGISEFVTMNPNIPVTSMSQLDAISWYGSFAGVGMQGLYEPAPTYTARARQKVADKYGAGSAMYDFLASYYNLNKYAAGGLVGNGRDRIPALLEPGEFVLRKQAVDKMGIDNAIRLNSTGNSGSNGDIEVEVNINNNGTSQTAVGTPEVRRVNGKIVVDIILEDLRNNGPINRQIRSIR